KHPDRRGTQEWSHKEKAIADVGRLIRANLNQASLANITIVPAPPSKAKNDPAYDDRIEKVASAIGGGADVRCLLFAEQS
ncbi:hypothetical protein RTF48_25105, partial [Escherichia coli]|nr:hypothetical protein [Escherichia coli]